MKKIIKNYKKIQCMYMYVSTASTTHFILIKFSIIPERGRARGSKGLKIGLSVIER